MGLGLGSALVGSLGPRLMWVFLGPGAGHIRTRSVPTPPPAFSSPFPLLALTAPLDSLAMAQAYHYTPNLLAPYLKLDQGGKIQAECTSWPFGTAQKSVRDSLTSGFAVRQTSGSMVTVGFAARPR